MRTPTFLSFSENFLLQKRIFRIIFHDCLMQKRESNGATLTRVFMYRVDFQYGLLYFLNAFSARETEENKENTSKSENAFSLYPKISPLTKLPACTIHISAVFDSSSKSALI